MISNVQFWRIWPNSLKIALGIFLFIIIALAGLTTFWVLNDIDNFYAWDIATELHKKFIASEAFVEKGLRFTNNELIYYLKEWYLPSADNINSNPSLVLVSALILGLSLITTSLSFQNNLWFLGSLILVAAFLILARTEIIFQATNNTPFLIAFASLGLTFFAFNSFLKRTGFWLRFLCISAVFIGLLFTAISYSKIDFPIVSLGSYSLLFALLCLAIFVFLIAHEIVVGLIYTVVASSEKGKNAFKTYLGIGLIYLLNCLLIYLENIRLIDDSLMVISPLLLFAASSVLGIWGFRKQCDDIGFFSFQRTGAWLYFGMFIISLATIGYVYATANDPLIELINDYIAIAHLSLGIVFFGHVILNFIGVFQKGLNAYLVLYKPKFSSLILAKILAVFIMGFFLIQKNIYAYNQLRAGLNSAIADFYLAEGDNTAAETYYKESINYDFFNHKANYALASMARKVGDGVTAAYFFRQAIQKNPSEFAYVGLSQNLENEDLYFDALFTLREGLAKFPKSAVLKTNSAHLLEKANVRDSVFLYLETALQDCKSCNTEKVNLQAFWIENAIPSKLDSVSNKLINASNGSNLANQLAIGRMTGNLKSQLKSLPVETSLNTTQFAEIYNQISLPENKLNKADSIWDTYANNPANIGVREDLLYLKILQLYGQGEKIKALKQLTYLAQDSTETALMYRRKLGLWYLKEGLYDRSVAFFAASGDRGSAQVLEENNFKTHLQLKQFQQAEELLQMELNQDTYKKLYREAPFNPYLLSDISNYLTENGKVSEAYTLVFDALEFNDTNIELWKKYAFLALKNGVPDYAENGVQKLKGLMTKEDYAAFLKSFNLEKTRLEREREAF
ncbi:tetratricopeptide repeat protein [Arcticibacterium luteifluviistationis]|uniref:Uncharacterized protein n=1 Tax=Arcticibacterium luteifluviistationis TaxID=1784714 RepID=A0A2Z4GEL3_9BACT|nr:hypothetical protein [Arcticibacterium luteifluviistationis]AWV99557.1 hypothetical protein DJ013_15830 [Arcticibacterium luteifluviistationis]